MRQPSRGRAYFKGRNFFSKLHLPIRSSKRSTVVSLYNIILEFYENENEKTDYVCMNYAPSLWCFSMFFQPQLGSPFEKCRNLELRLIWVAWPCLFSSVFVLGNFCCTKGLVSFKHGKR